MRTIAATMLMAGLVAFPLGAQGPGGWYGERAQRVPPGHLPPPGTCRVWYDRRPPGQQPKPTTCQEAERISSLDGAARVVYGRPAYPNRAPYPGAWDPQYPGGVRETVGGAPYQYGYRDGFEKGRQDARQAETYNPVRHERYRNADRGYEDRYGEKGEYRLVYRDGFDAGYEVAYREWHTSGR